MKKRLRGVFSKQIGDKLLTSINNEILLEFPSADDSDFTQFYKERKYDKISDKFNS